MIVMMMTMMCQVWEELRVGRGLGVLPALVPRVPRVRGRRGQDRGRRGGRHGGAPLAGGAGQVGGICIRASNEGLQRFHNLRATLLRAFS